MVEVMVNTRVLNRRFLSPHRSNPRQGAALLMCLFVIFMVSSLVLNVLDTELFQLAATRNTIEYEQSLYLANAGVHHACAELLQDNNWRSTVTDGVVPPASPAAGYTATATDDGLGNVTILSTGYAGTGARTVEATIAL